MLGPLIVTVALGLVALLLGFSRWLAQRPWAAAGNLAIGVLLLAVAQVYWPAALHLRSYERTPANGLVAQVHCERSGPQSYRVTLTWLPRGRMQVFEVAGDEWRLDARTLVWKRHAAMLGLPASYRFERLSARRLRSSLDPAEAATTLQLPEAYALANPDDAGDDLWANARSGTRWTQVVEPGRVYGPWRPLTDGARFDVWMTRAPGAPDVRLDARPAVGAAPQALRYTPADRVEVRASRG
jgi:hypothetical protein